MSDRQSEGGGDPPRVTPHHISMPLMMVVAAVVVVAGVTWSIANYFHKIEDRLDEAEGAIAEGAERDDELARDLTLLRRELLHRIPLDVGILESFEQLTFPRDFTKEARPRPRVAAVRRNLEVVDLAPMVTRQSIDRVWYSMTSREREALLIATPGLVIDNTD